MAATMNSRRCFTAHSEYSRAHTTNSNSQTLCVLMRWRMDVVLVVAETRILSSPPRREDDLSVTGEIADSSVTVQ